MLHHISLPVTNLNLSASFYDAALAPLGLVRVVSGEKFVGYGTATAEDVFAIRETANAVTPNPLFHLAFRAESRAAVDAFYEAAMAHGATDNGAPGLCTDYGENYYAAFVIDPDGYRLEAVITAPI